MIAIDTGAASIFLLILAVHRLALPKSPPCAHLATLPTLQQDNVRLTVSTDWRDRRQPWY